MCMYNTYYYNDLYESKQQKQQMVLTQDSRNKRYSK